MCRSTRPDGTSARWLADMIDQTAADLEGWVVERVGHPGGADRDTLLI
jgi:hypothetical protein